MKKCIFFLFLLFIIISCKNVNENSGIIIWEKSNEISYDFIEKSNIDFLLKKYPESVYIDFKDVKNYSKKKNVFCIQKEKWYPEHERKLGSYWMTCDVYYFTIILKQQKILTGISRTSDLWIESAKITQLPYENPIFLISTNEGLMLTTEDLHLFQKTTPSSQNIKFGDNLKILEQYFKSKGKLKK